MSRRDVRRVCPRPKSFNTISRLLFLAHLISTSRFLDLSRRVGRGDIWRRRWELLENMVYNKPNDCSASGSLAPGPEHHHQQQQTRYTCQTYHKLAERPCILITVQGGRVQLKCDGTR
jgi:hypothetical protein